MANVEKYRATLDLPKDKTIIITGGNSGIGFSTAKHLVRYDWRIILAVRSLSRGEKAKKTLLQTNPEAHIEVWEVDMAQRESILAFARRVKQSRLDVDAFYANAGVYRIPYQKTEDGFEMTCYVNYMANVLLFDALKDYLSALGHPVKYILTSSVVARFAHFTDEDYEPGARYKSYPAYQKSKVAVNQLFLSLCDECKGSNILPLLVHPGCTYTPLITKAYSGKRLSLAIQKALRFAFHGPDQAALCTLYLLQNSVKTSVFCGPKHFFHMTGLPQVYRLYRANTKGYAEQVQRTRELLSSENPD